MYLLLGTVVYRSVVGSLAACYVARLLNDDAKCSVLTVKGAHHEADKQTRLIFCRQEYIRSRNPEARLKRKKAGMQYSTVCTVLRTVRTVPINSWRMHWAAEGRSATLQVKLIPDSEFLFAPTLK